MLFFSYSIDWRHAVQRAKRKIPEKKKKKKRRREKRKERTEKKRRTRTNHIIGLWSRREARISDVAVGRFSLLSVIRFFDDFACSPRKSTNHSERFSDREKCGTNVFSPLILRVHNRTDSFTSSPVIWYFTSSHLAVWEKFRYVISSNQLQMGSPGDSLRANALCPAVMTNNHRTFVGDSIERKNVNIYLMSRVFFSMKHDTTQRIHRSHFFSRSCGVLTNRFGRKFLRVRRFCPGNFRSDENKRRAFVCLDLRTSLPDHDSRSLIHCRNRFQMKSNISLSSSWSNRLFCRTCRKTGVDDRQKHRQSDEDHQNDKQGQTERTEGTIGRR